MQFEWFHLWTFPVILLCYYGYELVITRKLAQKPYPLVGRGSVLIPQFVLNLIFAWRGGVIVGQGYEKFRDRAFQVIRHDGSVILLPIDIIDELSALPSTVASPSGALAQDLLGPYTGMDMIVGTRIHHTIVQRKLTPKLGILIPDLEEELVDAFKDYLPACEDWTEIVPYRLLTQISARLSARAFVGPSFCRNRTWLDVSIYFTEAVFTTAAILRLFPAWMHSFLRYLVPSYWQARQYVRSGQALLSPKIRDLLDKNDAGTWKANSKEDYNALSWLAESAKGADRNLEALAHVEVLLALASVHTTSLRMVNVLYDLIANPQYLDGLRDEITTISKTQEGWTPASYQHLQKLDSVMRESQRLSPPTTVGMRRLFRQPHTFSNGIHVPQGTYICMPTFAIENDPSNTTDPAHFDGDRAYHLRQQRTSINARDDEHLFTTPEPTVLNFGIGKTACPGRFFAGAIIKIFFAKLLMEYEFRFLPGRGRPKNIMLHEFFFALPWGKIQMKRRKNCVGPF